MPVFSQFQARGQTHTGNHMARFTLSALPGSLMTLADFFRKPSRTSVIPCRLGNGIAGNALAIPLTLQGVKRNFLIQSLISILYFGVMESCLLVKCYSHDTVVCAVYVWGCILEHHWTETWEDRNQFHKEPSRPVICLKALEMGTDDGEGPIHYKISHSRWEVRDLSNYDMRGFKHHTVF